MTEANERQNFALSSAASKGPLMVLTHSWFLKTGAFDALSGQAIYPTVIDAEMLTLQTVC
jgi:hypothetical protein